MSTSHGSIDRSELAGSAAMCATGFEAGFELHPIQRIAAVATPSQWRDAIVTSVSPDGIIDVVDLESGAASALWNYENLSEIVAAGSPVSLHSEYGVLAIGRDYRSVRIAA